MVVPVWQRLKYALASTISLALLAYIYLATVATRITDFADGFSGPFTFVIEWINQIVPVAIVILLLALWGWVLAGAVRNERAVRRLPRR